MARKETLAEKKAVTEAVANETKRCIAIVEELHEWLRPVLVDRKDDPHFFEAINRIVQGCPSLEFHPELLHKMHKRG